MIAASKDGVEDVSIPSFSDNFWMDMSNPHNLGTMWVGKDGVWKIIKSLEDEEIEKLEKKGDSDKIWKLKQRKNQEEIIEELPELRPVLLELAQIYIDEQLKLNNIIKKLNNIKSKIKDSDVKYQISIKLDYAMNGLESLKNQFGYILPELENKNGNWYLKSKRPKS